MAETQGVYQLTLNENEALAVVIHCMTGMFAISGQIEDMIKTALLVSAHEDRIKLGSNSLGDKILRLAKALPDGVYNGP